MFLFDTVRTVHNVLHTLSTAQSKAYFWILNYCARIHMYSATVFMTFLAFSNVSWRNRDTRGWVTSIMYFLYADVSYADNRSIELLEWSQKTQRTFTFNFCSSDVSEWRLGPLAIFNMVFENVTELTCQEQGWIELRHISKSAKASLRRQSNIHGYIPTVQAHVSQRTHVCNYQIGIFPLWKTKYFFLLNLSQNWIIRMHSQN